MFRALGVAIRESLVSAGAMERGVIATRFGQVVLCEVTDAGRTARSSLGIDPGARPRVSLPHRFWVQQAACWYESKGYNVARGHPVHGNGAVDVLASRPGEKIAVEIETGTSDVRANIRKIRNAGFDRIVLLATPPAAFTVCQHVLGSTERLDSPPAELLTWLDISQCPTRGGYVLVVLSPCGVAQP